MNQLMNVTTMTSMQIAKITGKLHHHILRDIKDELEKLAIGGLNGETKFGLSSYTTDQNKQMPCYNLTEKGVLQLAARYDAVTRAKLIDLAMKSNEPQISQSFAEPSHFNSWSPVNLRGWTYEKLRHEAEKQSKTINAIAEKYIHVGMDLVELSVALNQVEKLAASISNNADLPSREISLIESPDVRGDWKTDINRKIASIASTTGKADLNVRGMLYGILEKEANVNLNSRKTNLKARMKKSGATYKDQKAVSKIDAIACDKQLKLTFEEIVWRFV